jgi:heme-degrading monooxygenase HmoA
MQISTLSFFRFKGFKNKFWAFKTMGEPISGIKLDGAKLIKKMGTGGGDGYQWYPDFSTYAVLIIWESEAQADAFFKSANPWFTQYKKHAFEQCTFWLKAISAHGKWDNKQPFNFHKEDSNLPIAVITRATIKFKNLWQFWKRVPSVSDTLKNFKGNIFGKGMGEWPLVQQATFSVWKSKEELFAYAYKSEKHRAVIKKTRELDWYSEEMFIRFQPFKFEGTWRQKNPLQDLC